MACLRIADVNTVQKNRNLIVRSTVDRDVRLYTKATALTDIHARG